VDPQIISSKQASLPYKPASLGICIGYCCTWNTEIGRTYNGGGASMLDEYWMNITPTAGWISRKNYLD